MTEVRHEENIVQNESVQKSGKCRHHNSDFLRIRERAADCTQAGDTSAVGDMFRVVIAVGLTCIYTLVTMHLNCILVVWTCVLYTPKARSWRKFSSRSPPASTMVLATKKDVEKEQLLHHDGSRGEMLLNACQCINEAWYYSIIGPLSHSKQNQGCGGMIDRFQQV